MNELNSLPIVQPKTVPYDFHITLDNIDTCLKNGDISGILQPVWMSVSVTSPVEQYYEQMSHFTQEQQNAFAVMGYFSEVLNGGHAQFFDNSIGMSWEEVNIGLQAMDQDIYEVFEASIGKFSSLPSKDRQTRRKQLDGIEGLFEDLDERFFSINRQSDVFDILISYIEKSKQQFLFSGVLQISEKLSRRLRQSESL